MLAKQGVLEPYARVVPYSTCEVAGSSVVQTMVVVFDMIAGGVESDAGAVVAVAVADWPDTLPAASNAAIA